MPAPPEGGHAVRAVGVIEVRKEFKAEHLRRADGHVGIAAKVKIEHQRVQKRAQPRTADGERLRPQRLQRVKRRAEQPGENDLLRQPDDEQPHPAADALAHEFMRLQLRLHVGVLHDRPGGQLRKKRDEQGEADEVLLHRCPPVIHVRECREQRERIKRHADRRGQRVYRQGQHEHPVQGRRGLAVIFEKQQREQVSKDRQHQNEAGMARLPVLQQRFQLQPRKIVE